MHPIGQGPPKPRLRVSGETLYLTTPDPEFALPRIDLLNTINKLFPHNYLVISISVGFITSEKGVSVIHDSNNYGQNLHLFCNVE